MEASEENEAEVVDFDETIPRKGMQFISWKKVECFYKKYAQTLGFGIARTQAASCSDKRTKRAVTWKCECWGHADCKKRNEEVQIEKQMEIGGSSKSESCKRKRRKSKKCGCLAKLYASLNSSGLWEIRNVVLQHNGHTPSPEKSKLVKEYRMGYLNSSVRNRLFSDVDVGVSVSKIHGSIARERDGLENMPITERDMRHVIDSRRRLKMEGGDANALFAYFERMQRDNDQFFHTYRVDELGRLKDVFWADARSRAAYEEFGDVVCFDTTYLTNKYKLPFANFVGVNHHAQSILLGCALLSREDIDTFKWVFSKWMTCMGGKEPGGILTDQAYAMRQPLVEVMPGSRHRWCIWHILRKIPHKLGKHPKYEELKEELLSAIYDTLCVDEFEKGWNRVIGKYKLDKVGWLTYIYKERSMWVPAFMSDHFWAGMRTTQRVESMNSYFDQFVKRSTRLCEFGEKYIAAIERRVCQERDADMNCDKYIRNPATGLALELYFRQIYSDAKYRAIQTECERLVYVYHVAEMQIADNEVVYMLEDRVWKYRKGGLKQYLSDEKRLLRVKFNPETLDVECECKLFETHGLLCRHCIRILDMNRVYTPPEKYVLRRWRKDIVRKHSLIKVTYHDPSKTEDVRRYDEFNVMFDPMAVDASTSEKAAEIMRKGLQRISKQLEHQKEKEKDKCGGLPNGSQNNSAHCSQQENVQSDEVEIPAHIDESTPIISTDGDGHQQTDPINEGVGSEEEINYRQTNGNHVVDDLTEPCIHVYDNLDNINLQSDEDVEDVVEEDGETNGSSYTVEHIIVSTGDVGDPPLPKKKRGRPKGLRYKSAGEKGWKASNKSKAKTMKSVEDGRPGISGANENMTEVEDGVHMEVDGVNEEDLTSIDELIGMIVWQ